MRVQLNLRESVWCNFFSYLFLLPLWQVSESYNMHVEWRSHLLQLPPWILQEREIKSIFVCPLLICRVVFFPAFVNIRLV